LRHATEKYSQRSRSRDRRGRPRVSPIEHLNGRFDSALNAGSTSAMGQSACLDTASGEYSAKIAARGGCGGGHGDRGEICRRQLCSIRIVAVVVAGGAILVRIRGYLHDLRGVDVSIARIRDFALSAPGESRRQRGVEIHTDGSNPCRSSAGDLIDEAISPPSGRARNRGGVDQAFDRDFVAGQFGHDFPARKHQRAMAEIDVGAKAEIYRLLDEALGRGHDWSRAEANVASPASRTAKREAACLPPRSAQPRSSPSPAMRVSHDGRRARLSGRLGSGHDVERPKMPVT